MDVLPEITLELSYDWSSGEDEEDENSQDASVQSSRCAYMTSADLDKLEKSKNEANTVRQTAWALNCFHTWLSVKKINIDFKSVKKTELNTVLRQFYGSIRTTKGEFYSISSYLGLRAGLNRFINEPPISRSWNLMQDPEFTPANNVFKGVLKEIRRAGRDRTAHYPPISPEDQDILKHSSTLNPDNPKGLLNKVWYDIQLHFGRRGKEGNRELKPDSFILKRDENGAKYFTMTLNEETKNRKDPLERGKVNRRGAMFEEPGNPHCPVASLEKYLSKMPPGAKALYLQPRSDVVATDTFWYTTIPLGVNQLSQMLPRMCKEAGTHTSYTNHSLRATALQKLSDAGVETRETTAISEHRSISLMEMSHQDGGIQQTTTRRKCQKTAKMSAVWDHFNLKLKEKVVQCNICKCELAYHYSTSSMLQHLKRKHAISTHEEPSTASCSESRTTGGDSEEDVKEPMVCCSKKRPHLKGECCGDDTAVLNVITVDPADLDQIPKVLEQEVRTRERELTMQLRRAQEQEARALEQQRALTEQMRRVQEEDMKRVRDQEAQALERERQAIEQLRRIQEQEARMLEQQRELSEQLRRAQEQEMKRVRDQEAQALERERQAIEQMRRAQEQEARAIEREREALEQLRRELEQDRRTLQRQAANGCCILGCNGHLQKTVETKVEVHQCGGTGSR